jgi:hypothetical protein
MIVKDKYRLNPLSLQPGGHKVHVVFEDGFELVYDKVKYPGAYIRKVSKESKRKFPIAKVYVDDSPILDFDKYLTNK